MTKLVDLLGSLITTIRTNHDTHVSNPSSFSYDTKNLSTLAETLETMIERSTRTYKDRVHLLNYLLHEAIFIKDLLMRDSAFTDEELLKCKQELKLFLIDLRELLKTNKSTTYKVSYSQMSSKDPVTVDLTGLVNGYFFCASGTIINTEIITRLGLTGSSNDSTITAFINELCDDHQTSLLASETLRLRKQLADAHTAASEQTRAHKIEIESLTRTLEQARTEQQEFASSHSREKTSLEQVIEQERAKQVELAAGHRQEKTSLEQTLERERSKQIEIASSHRQEKIGLEQTLERERSSRAEVEGEKRREKEALEQSLAQEQSRRLELEERLRVQIEKGIKSESEELLAAKKRIAELESEVRNQASAKGMPSFRHPTLGAYYPLLFPKAPQIPTTGRGPTVPDDTDAYKNAM